MCTKDIECLRQQSDKIPFNQHHYNQAEFVMEGASATPSSAPSSNEDNLRVKFLCSFSGSILPRPQDGKLRYVGGETRIVSVPRDITYEELMGRMKELYESAVLLKYQQPDEDLDALVSVVNDDDVTNMMEEYDKLGSGDGFTRLRIFLFSHLDQEFSPHFDVDERDNERRYVDALNSLNDASEFRKQQLNGSPVDEIHHVAEQFFNQRNCEMPPILPFNLHHLNIPHLGSGQVDTPWSPAYYSPRHHGHHEQRQLSEFPSSPSSARYRMPFGEFTDNHHPIYDQPQFPDNLVWLPSGTIASDKSGFPGNILHGQGHNNFFDGNNICEHCRSTFQRTQPHLEQQANLGNGFHNAANTNSCTECHRNYNHGIYANVPLGHGNFSEGHHAPPNFTHHEDPTSTYPHPMNEGVRIGGNMPYPYGTENLYQVPHGHVPSHAIWRNVQNPVQHDANATASPVLIRSPLEGSPRFHVNMDNQNQWVDPSQRIPGFDGHNLKINTNTLVLENQHLLNPDSSCAAPMQPLKPSSNQVDDRYVPSTTCINTESRHGLTATEAVHDGIGVTNEPIMQSVNGDNNSKVENMESATRKGLMPADEKGDNVKINANDIVPPLEQTELSPDNLSFIPELIASVKKAALEGAEEVKARVQENAAYDQLCNAGEKEEVTDELESGNASDLGSENDNPNMSKIEPTKAEEEAIARGLQTIKNDDLEEIRELGSGTYGAVYHGKWKGSDVAIKRIKASCFAGRPSERQRLIADFWKEALILSSLHHPNVVSFYGIVRDGPDGSLATVTEFMVNGSLKQFLQKKDRTIDRRKRLIIAMDAAFGMEYLHGKNIVHFDLKCENLLVNMRDPHRPVCKIGDLGLSKVKQHTLVSGGVRGTLPWMAPELLSGKSNMVTEKIDVYSFGIVMWELLTGEEPYADRHCASIIGGIVNNTLRPQIPAWCDPEWKALMESCWASDPAERPSFSEISQKLRSMAAAMNVK